MENRFERTTSRQGKMVLKGEGRGKISSPHSVNDFGDKKTSLSGEVWSIIDHYMIFHLSWYFLGRKIGGIGLQGPF
jgi:hypothetical protein